MISLLECYLFTLPCSLFGDYFYLNPKMSKNFNTFALCFLYRANIKQRESIKQVKRIKLFHLLVI